MYKPYLLDDLCMLVELKKQEVTVLLSIRTCHLEPPEGR